MLVRLYFARGAGFELFPALTRRTRGWKKILVIGAGNTGESVIREIMENSNLKLVPVGILDDDPDAEGKTIHGIPIIGPIDMLKRVPLDFDEVLIATRPVGSREMRKIVDACEEADKPYLILPRMGEIIDGTVSVKSVREVNLADLLGREEISLDKEAIDCFLRGGRVLVTGAGGSIGSELVRHICGFRPEALAILDFSENDLFAAEMECLNRFEHVPVRTFLADIRNRDTVARVFRDFRPQVVFHAAAYTHVPLQEMNPREAVINNVLGTRNLVQEALAAEVACFVLVSTDKAVRPANVMGATKRVAEMMMECSNKKGDCRFMSVRFGNVLASSGSVISIFEDQIAKGGPVTITHAEAARCFMGAAEASMLVLQAGAIGKGGETFVLDMGEPIRIRDMAEDLIRLHGLEPGEDIQIRFIGLRPGEKLLEERSTEGEDLLPTGHEKILLHREEPCDADLLETSVDELIRVAETHDNEAIKLKLREIVKDYAPGPSVS